MPRKQRKRLKFDESSVNGLLQEIYDDSHNIRAKIVRLFNKWETKAKDGGDIAGFGDQIVKLITAESKNQDQKLVILRYLKEVVFEKGDGESGSSSSSSSPTTTDRNEIIRLAQQSLKSQKEKKK